MAATSPIARLRSLAAWRFFIDTFSMAGPGVGIGRCVFTTVRRKSHDVTKRKPAEAGLLETEALSERYVAVPLSQKPETDARGFLRSVFCGLNSGGFLITRRRPMHLHIDRRPPPIEEVVQRMKARIDRDGIRIE